MRLTISMMAVVTAVGLFACGQPAAGGGETGLGAGLCSASSPCPSGQFCFNGICAVGCQSSGDCASDQYCDTEFDRLCHNKVVQTCHTQPDVCLASQVCVGGLCSTPAPATQCDPEQVVTGSDGCEKNAVCFAADDEQSAPKCQSFPACAEDKTCPAGLMGAVCNDGLIPNKGHICLTGLCKAADNCPANWRCVKMTANAPVGFCSDGGMGSPCSSAGECTSGNCMQAMPGTPGVCM